MSRFAVYHKRFDDGRIFLPGGGTVGNIVRLFINDVPDGVPPQIISDVLRKAGRDPSLMDVAVSSITIASEATWPGDVRSAMQSTGVETISWQTLQDEAAGWRRISIRVTPQLLVMAQAEAERRHQSLTQFCVDAIQQQVGTRSHRIEHEIYRLFYSGGFSEKNRSTSLSSLRSFVSRTIPDCTFQEIEYALRRLNPRFIKLSKWHDGLGFRLYDGADDNDFFYRGDFRLEVTPEGEAYGDALSGSTRAVDGFLNVLRAEPGTGERLGQFAVFFAPVDSPGGAMTPHYCADTETLREFLVALGLLDRAVTEAIEETLKTGSTNIRVALPKSSIDLI